MTRAQVAVTAVVVAVLAVLALTTGRRLVERFLEHDPGFAPPNPARLEPATGTPSAADYRGFLYGRVTTVEGASYEGRLRFGGGEEGFWGDAFNGTKSENPWAAYLEEAERGSLSRPFMARFGDLARIEVEGRDLRVTLKSGATFRLDRYGADDIGDGIRVWDDEHGVVDLGDRRIRSVALRATEQLNEAPIRLYGDVDTRRGRFTGFVQWNREEGMGSDELEGTTPEGPVELRFDALRSIARATDDSSRVTLRDGRELVLGGTREAGAGNRGLYVEDNRYGRVLVSWDAFEKLEFVDVGSGPGYDDYPPGSPLTGAVLTRSGRRLAGRLIYDLDESETTETLDAPAGGVDYTILFGLIASIDLGSSGGTARVVLQSGEELELERAGDLAESNGGLLVFADGDERPELVSWLEVERIDLDLPSAMYPPLGEG